MKEFLEQYIANLLEGLENQELRLRDIPLLCTWCPLREKCAASALDDECTCDEFIRNMVPDGEQFS